MIFELEEHERAVPVVIAERSATLGALVDMTDSEAGMYLLSAWSEARRQEWSAHNLGAHAAASIGDALPRRGGSSQVRNYEPVVRAWICDALAWLVANSLVGPSAGDSRGADFEITTRGREALLAGSASHVEATRRLHADLHPALQRSARPNFERGDYDIAAFASMRAVEEALREAAGLEPGAAYSTGLVNQAMRADGPMAITTETAGEQTAFMNLFQGAIGAFKNPASHRAVEYDDPVEAADIVHLADLLLRIIDRERARRGAPVEQGSDKP